MRSPRRTAQTASALMVGLALVSTIAVFGASLSRSATSSVDQAISADYIITSSTSGAERGFSAAVAAAAAPVPGVTAVSTVYTGPSSSRASLSTLTAVSADQSGTDVILRMSAAPGRPRWPPADLLVDTTTANSTT